MATGGPSLWQALRRRWPAALGLAAAVVVLATGADRETLAIVVGVATLCYLAAAVSGRRWMAWVAVLGASVVVAASEVTGLPWWIGMGAVALGLVVVGLLTRVPLATLGAQTAALLGYGGLAVVALYLAPQAGPVLAGLVLAGHGVWDLVHYRRDRVVSRSLAEFCMLLDVPLGLGFVVLGAAL